MVFITQKDVIRNELESRYSSRTSDCVLFNILRYEVATEEKYTTTYWLYTYIIIITIIMNDITLYYYYDNEWHEYATKCRCTTHESNRM